MLKMESLPPEIRARNFRGFGEGEGYGCGSDCG